MEISEIKKYYKLSWVKLTNEKDRGRVKLTNETRREYFFSFNQRSEWN